MENSTNSAGNGGLRRNVTVFSPDLTTMLFIPEENTVFSVLLEILFGKKEDPVADYLEAQELRIKLSKSSEMIWSCIRSGDVDRVSQY